MSPRPRSVSDLAAAGPSKPFVCEDPRSKELFDRLGRVAPSNVTVLITGETGTGKEIVAKHIHALSRRGGGPFCAVNCGAIADSLVESELFGHERGAFTGATTASAGWFEAAYGGTLFLDEVGELPASAQVKLLRVLQEREVVRVGSRRPVPVDVRVVAATHVDLAQAVAAGRFREDLFFRLCVAQVEILPLRERRGDILPLARMFLGALGEELGMPVPELDAGAEALLLGHDWRGNVRELENAIHRAVVNSRGHVIRPEDLALPSGRPVVRSASQPRPSTLGPALLSLFKQDAPNLYETIEEEIFRTAYEYTGQNQLQTSQLLGISRNIARARLAQYGQIPRRRGRRGPIRAERRRTVRIGYQKYWLLALAKARGEFDRAMQRVGVDLRWVEFRAGLPLVQAMRNGSIDLGVVGEGPPVCAQAAGAPLVYVGAERSAPEGEAIVVHGDSAIRRVVDLRGRRIAVNEGSNTHFLLLRALHEAGLDYDDVRMVFGSPEAATEAFSARTVDAWAIWDPFLAWTQEATNARVLRDARGLASNTLYYVAAPHLLEEHPEFVEAFVGELDGAAGWAAHHPSLAGDLLARELGFSHATWRAALGRNPGPRTLDPELVASQQQVADTFFDARVIPRRVSVSRSRWGAASIGSCGLSQDRAALP